MESVYHPLQSLFIVFVFSGRISNDKEDNVIMFEVFPTGTDSSYQNGSVETSNHTITTSTKDLLFGATLDAKFCPCMFTHAIQIWNALPHCDQTADPILLETDKKDVFNNIRTFGCQMWVHHHKVVIVYDDTS